MRPPNIQPPLRSKRDANRAGSPQTSSPSPKRTGDNTGGRLRRGRQKEGLITWDLVHYLGPPAGRVKRGLDRGGPENGRYLGDAGFLS